MLPLSEEDDRVSWSLENSRKFSTSSLYLSLTHGAAVTCFKKVWHTRVPPKIKIFLWQLIQGKLPSSSQVAKRRGPLNGRCTLCGEIEHCNHIFFECIMAIYMLAGVRDLLQCDWNQLGLETSWPFPKACLAPFVD